MPDLDPFKTQDVAYEDFPDPNDARFGSELFREVKELQVGQGDRVFRANESGIWLGGATFASANFSVDMDGNVIAGSITLSGYIPTGGAASDVNAGAGSVNANRINASTLSAISANLGAITAGTIDGVTITGGTLQTATTGRRIKISSSPANRIEFYDSTTLYGWLEADKVGSAGYINLKNYDSSTGLEMYTGVGASAYASVSLYSYGGSFDSSGNGTNTYITMSNAYGDIGIAHEPSHSPNDYAYVNLPFEIQSTAKFLSTVLFNGRVDIAVGAGNAFIVTGAGTAGAVTGAFTNTGDAAAMFLVNSSNTYGTLALQQGGTADFIFNTANTARLTKAGVWTNASARKYKENFEKMDVLDRLKFLNLYKYNYKTDVLKSKIEKTKVEKHFTPVAEDFHRVFGLGKNDSISAADLAGIALQAVKELNIKMEKKLLVK